MYRTYHDMQIHVLHARDCVGVARDRRGYIGTKLGTCWAHGAVGQFWKELVAGMAFYRPIIKHYQSYMVFA